MPELCCQVVLCPAEVSNDGGLRRDARWDPSTASLSSRPHPLHLSSSDTFYSKTEFRNQKYVLPCAVAS